MADFPSSLLLLRLQSTGSNTNLWGGYLNVALQTLEQAGKGYQALVVTGDAVISWSNYSTGNNLQFASVRLTGALSSPATLTAPSYPNFVMVRNDAGQTVTIKCAAATGVAIPSGRKTLLYCDGTDYISATPSWLSDSNTLSNNGDLPTYSQMVAYVAAAIAAATTSVTALMSRFVYTATGGETSKSGADDSGNVLAYTAGSELVTLNGVQQIRNVDYVGSTGASITGLIALVAGDILSITAFASVAVPSCFSIANNLSEGTPATMRANLGLDTGNSPTFAGLTVNGTATVTTLTATGQASLGGTAGAESFRATSVASSVNRIQAEGNTTGNSPTLRAKGGDLNVNFLLTLDGAGSYQFYTGGPSFVQQLQIPHVANAVNRFELRGSATTNGIDFRAAGSDTNIDIAYRSAGTGAHRLFTGGGEQVQIQNTASATRYITLTGSNGSQSTIGTNAGLLDLKPAGASVGLRVDSGAVLVGPTIAVPAGGTAMITMGSSGPVMAIGSGAPTISAVKGSIYYRADGSSGTRAYINTDGSTTWTGITTAA